MSTRRPYMRVGAAFTRSVGAPFKSETIYEGQYYLAEGPLGPDDIDVLQATEDAALLLNMLRVASYQAEVYTTSPSTIYMSGARPITFHIWAPGDALKKGEKVFIVPASILEKKE